VKLSVSRIPYAPSGSNRRKRRSVAPRTKKVQDKRMIKRQTGMERKENIKRHRKADVKNNNKPWKTGMKEGIEREGSNTKHSNVRKQLNISNERLILQQSETSRRLYITQDTGAKSVLST
jgi:hypothetical protein